jgi:hypothetical protein
MEPTITIPITYDNDTSILSKWKMMLEYTDRYTPIAIPEKYHLTMARLFEKVEYSIKPFLLSAKVPNDALKTIIPFFQRNWQEFLDVGDFTMEHFPLNIARGQLGEVIHKYESDLMGNHLWEHDLVNLWKINDKFWLI